MDFIWENIMLDSFIYGVCGYVELEEFKNLTPLVRDYELLYMFYCGKYKFSKDELLILLYDLNYLGSKRKSEIMLLMKYSFYEYDIKGTLGQEYNKIDIKDGMFLSAVKLDCYNIVKLLIRKYAIKKSNDAYQEVLQKLKNSTLMSKSLLVAVKNCNFEIMDLLLGTDFSFQILEYNILNVACETGNIDCIKLLVEKYRILLNKTQAVKIACNKDNLDLLKLLIEFGADIKINNNEAIQIASKRENIQILKLLIENGVDWHVLDNYPLKIAATRNNIPMIDLFTETYDEHILKWALFNNFKNLVNYLIIKWNITDYYNLITFCATNNLYEMFKLLIDIEKNILNEIQLEDLLKLSVINENIEILKLIINYIIHNTEQSDNYPLIITQEKQTKIANLLLKQTSKRNFNFLTYSAKNKLYNLVISQISN